MSSLQEERSAQTRARLLDATVACLYERGYANTTTTEIATRAGVSRGGQLHHFPHKDELVVSALEHVFELRLTEMRAAVAEPLAGSSREHRLAALIDVIWPAFNGPSFYAWLELVVASRTDPALNEAVRAASERFGEGFRASLIALLEWPASRSSEFDDLMSLLLGQLESLALERILFSSDEKYRHDFDRALDNLKRLGTRIVRDVESAGARIERREAAS